MTLKKRTNHMTVLGKVAIILNIVYIFIPSALFVSLTLYTSVCLCINLLFWVQSKKKGQYYIYKRDILLIGYLCCILISCFVSVDLDASLSYCIMLASALFLYFASFNFSFVSAYVFPYTEAYFAFFFFESYPLMYRPSHLPSLRLRIFSPLRGMIFTPFVLTTKLTRME